ncbi:hypothetical protein R1flu_010182 [Riccia fluitans]|uniref:Uncharacterized protein n=1 Tax=Riccia fluitans TaxID=41844 RepID=A0ABD1Z4F3_9MARC
MKAEEILIESGDDISDQAEAEIDVTPKLDLKEEHTAERDSEKMQLIDEEKSPEIDKEDLPNQESRKQEATLMPAEEVAGPSEIDWTQVNPSVGGDKVEERKPLSIPKKRKTNREKYSNDIHALLIENVLKVMKKKRADKQQEELKTLQSEDVRPKDELKWKDDRCKELETVTKEKHQQLNVLIEDVTKAKEDEEDTATEAKDTETKEEDNN